MRVPAFAPFTASIETQHGASHQHPYHLGTDERIARSLVVELFRNRVKHGQPVVTIALMRDPSIVDVFDGEWQSDRANRLFDEVHAQGVV